jgi:TPR repeat protein
MLKRLIVLLMLALSPIILAGIYKWVDEKGITHIGNDRAFGEKEIIDKQLNEGEKDHQDLNEESVLKEADTAFNSNNYTKALALLKPIAERGNTRAQNGLGLIYGRGLGVPKDLRESFRWHQKAAEQGYGLAQYYLGLMFADGEGVLKDAVEGGKWVRKAAEKGVPAAQFDLGVMYAKGEGGEEGQSPSR